MLLLVCSAESFLDESKLSVETHGLFFPWLSLCAFRTFLSVKEKRRGWNGASTSVCTRDAVDFLTAFILPDTPSRLIAQSVSGLLLIDDLCVMQHFSTERRLGSFYWGGDYSTKCLQECQSFRRSDSS